MSEDYEEVRQSWRRSPIGVRTGTLTADFALGFDHGTFWATSRRVFTARDGLGERVHGHYQTIPVEWAAGTKFQGFKRGTGRCQDHAKRLIIHHYTG